MALIQYSYIEQAITEEKWQTMMVKGTYLSFWLLDFWQNCTEGFNYFKKFDCKKKKS